MEHFGYEATRAHNYPHQMIFYDFRFGYSELLHRWDEINLRGVLASKICFHISTWLSGKERESESCSSHLNPNPRTNKQTNILRGDYLQPNHLWKKDT